MDVSLNSFKNKVIEAVSLIPPGKVASYGQVALYIGTPRAARQVGWILRESGEREGVPWWRVINQKGAISIKGNLTADRELQKKLLEAEGVAVSDEFIVDLGKFQFVPSDKELKKLQLSNLYIDNMTGKF